LLYVLYGPDSFSIHNEMDNIKISFGGDISADNNVMSIDGSSVNIEEFKIACETIPFLAEKRFVVVNGLLGRFESKNKTSYKSISNRSRNENSEYPQFIESMKNLHQTTILVLIDGEIDKKNPLLGNLSSFAEIKYFPLLKNRDLQDWIKKYVGQKGGRVSSNSAELISKLVGNDLWAMKNEIDKVILFTGDKIIEENDVKLIVSYAQEINVFSMVDSIMDKKLDLAQQQIQQLIAKGASPAYLLSMLARQIRLAMLVKEMTSKKESKSEIQSKLRLADFAFRKSLEQAEKFPIDKIKAFFEKLLDTDIAIKIGKYNEELALSILVVELCQ
jgi:DNA polymerase III subunit delta